MMSLRGTKAIRDSIQWVLCCTVVVMSLSAGLLVGAQGNDDVVRHVRRSDASVRDVDRCAVLEEEEEGRSATAAETQAGFDDLELSSEYPPGDVLRYQLIPNDATARARNTAILRKLVSATGASPYTGRVRFTNTTGADVYYFDDIIQVKDGIVLDLDGSTLDFAKRYVVADDYMGFLTFVRDVTIENGAINVNYDGIAGKNAGSGLRIGSRRGYPFGGFTRGIEDEDLTVAQGGITVRNLRVTTNNASAAPILMLGGLDGVSMENVLVDGQGAAIKGIYYEFGFWHHNHIPARTQSSHARNLSFKNIYISDLNTGSAVAFSLVGALSAWVSGLWIDGSFNGVVIRSGEALYYNVGTPGVGARARIVLENINGKNIASNGIYLQGAERASGGYLSAIIAALPANRAAAAQTDLIEFFLNGFSIDASGVGLRVSGPSVIRNGSLHGTASSGQVIIDDECVQFDFDDVRVVGSSGIGIRANFGGAVWNPARLKIGSIRNCLVAGNGGPSISIDKFQSVLIENCRLGDKTVNDPFAEAIQMNDVSASAATARLVCGGKHASISGGKTAYATIAGGEPMTMICIANDPPTTP